MKGETQPQRRGNSHLEQDICIHIFTVSSAMVGVCLTVIGLIRVVITLGTADTLADDLLAADALLFLISCLLSYWALRSRGLRRMHRLEKIADAIFIIAMIGDGGGLCVDHLYDFCSKPIDRGLKHVCENSQPSLSVAALDAARASDGTLVLE
jgi:hypothetical protein